MNRKIAIFGTSGFATEVADICFDLGYIEVSLLAENNNTVRNVSNLDTKLENDINFIKDKGYVFALGVGDPTIRKKIVENNPELVFPNIIHPTVTFGRNQYEKISDSRGNVVAAGVRFTNNIKIGNYNVFNLNVTIGHDCILHDFINIAPGANISGNVEIHNCVSVGTNATILQGTTEKKLEINEYVTVGANSLVRKNVNKNLTVFGLPARPLKQ